MDYQMLSKEISYILRHAPWEYELELDEEGWVDINQLLFSMHECKEWQKLSKWDLKLMIEKSDKQRHEILDGKIRALYGHSISQRIIKEPKIPPEILYHGTAKRFIQTIKKQGLLSQSRQYVHLSVHKDMAFRVGRRKDENPVVLLVKAKLAWKEGVSFYRGNDKVWLSDSIKVEYIEFQ